MALSSVFLILQGIMANLKTWGSIMWKLYVNFKAPLDFETSRHKIIIFIT